MTVSANPSVELNEPPVPTRTVLITGLVGAGLVLLAFLIGLVTGAPSRGFDKHGADGIRMLLCVAGLVVAGCAISMRPDWFGGWLCGAAAGLIGYGIGMPPPAGTEWQVNPPRHWFAGVPNSWDSIHIFFGVSGVIGLIGAARTYLPRKAICTLMVLGVAYHFAGILSAVTSPPPTPWLTDQYWKRVARPYLQFTYMNNAYQFYSPDPGPATELWVCYEYDTGNPDPDAPKDCEWEYIPRRDTHFNDPLGLTFYRRLSITENVAQYANLQVPDLEEQEKIMARRNLAARDGIARKGWTDDQEHRLPNELVYRQLLPSYSRHLAAMNANPDKKLKSIKMYRTLHLLAMLPEFRGFDANLGRPLEPIHPNDPKQYLPYFQGEYDPKGNLVDPTEPLLYWLVPILPEPYRAAPLDRDLYKRNGGFQYYYVDYVSKHAGCPRPIKE